jgi:hypothetical protein
MPARLAAGMLVAALIRRTEAAGGHAMVIARGDPTAGALLIQLAERGISGALLERTLTADGTYRWQPAGPVDPADRSAYLDRRRRSDPDLWVLEVDAADGHALVEDVTG